MKLYEACLLAIICVLLIAAYADDTPSPGSASVLDGTDAVDFSTDFEPSDPQQLTKLQQSMARFLAEDLAAKAKVWQEASRKARAGEFDNLGLADARDFVKTSQKDAHDHAFKKEIAPYLESVNGDSWDAQRFAGGADQVVKFYNAAAKEYARYAGR